MNLEDRIKSKMEIGETRLVSDLAISLRVKVQEVRDCLDHSGFLDLIVADGGAYGCSERKQSEYEVERYE